MSHVKKGDFVARIHKMEVCITCLCFLQMKTITNSGVYFLAGESSVCSLQLSSN